MVQYFGDFAEDDSVLIPFNTFDSNDPSASVTITNLADADIMVHKDGGLTQIVTDGATVVINFDGITGNHMVTIDTSAHADYSVGSEYAVRIEGTTVDGATISAWIGAFSIERAGGALAIAKLIQAAVITNAAGADVAADIIAMKAETVLIVADTGELQADDVPGLIADVPTVAEFNARTLVAASYFDPTADAVATVTDLTNLPSIPGNWLTAAGIAASALDGKGDWNTDKTGFSLSTAGILAIWHQAVSAIVTASTIGKLLKDEITSARMATLTDWVDGGRLDLLLDAIQTDLDNGTDGLGALKTLIDAVKGDTVIPEKNVAFPNLPVFMVDSTDHVSPKTGLTLSVTRSFDGAAFGSATGTAAEISSGLYQFDASQADMNADKITFRFTAAGADDRLITIFTR